MTTRDAQPFVTELASRRSRETVGHIYNVLYGVFKVAAERRYVAASPCQGITLPEDDTARSASS